MRFKFLLFVFSYFFIILAYSQSGIITYKKTLDPPENIDSLKIKNPAIYKKVFFLYKNLKDYTESLTYTLKFSNNYSLFYTNFGLSKENNNFKNMLQDNTTYFTKNLNRYVKKDINGNELLIKKDSLSWSISDERKIISNYLCYKAEAIQKFYSVNKNTGNIKIQNQKIIAWFTKEIPLSFGPENYIGLPGLILKLRSQGKTYYVADIKLKNDKINLELEGTSNAISEIEAAQRINKAYSDLIGW